MISVFVDICVVIVLAVLAACFVVEDRDWCS